MPCTNRVLVHPVLSTHLSRDMMSPLTKSQRRKVLAHPVLSKHLGRDMMTPPRKGQGAQEHLTLPLRLIPTWMNTIIPSRAKPEFRERIVLYQEEKEDSTACLA